MQLKFHAEVEIVTESEIIVVSLSLNRAERTFDSTMLRAEIASNKMTISTSIENKSEREPCSRRIEEEEEAKSL